MLPPDDRHRRPKPPPLDAPLPQLQSADEPILSTGLDRQHHSVHAMAANRPSASSSDRSMSPASPSLPTSPSVAGSNTAKTKSKRGLKSFLTLKEPSTSAFEQYARQMKAETGVAKVPSGPSGSGISSRKLPDNIPKVNSKWDGLPKAASERHSSSIKRSTDGSQKRSDDGWTPPTSSGARSSGSRRKAGSDDTLRRKSSSKRPQRVDDHPRPEPPLRSSKVEDRPDSSIQIVPAMSTHPRDGDDEGLEDFGAIPEMSLFWPASYEPTDPIQSAGGVSETIQGSSTEPVAPPRSMPSSLPSDNSSPNMPQTPEDEEPLPADRGQKAVGSPIISHSRGSSADSGPEWPFPTTDPDYSARTSISDTAPPPIPMKSQRRRSFDSFSAHTRSASNATDRQLDGSSQTTPTGALPSRTRSFSRPRYQKADDQSLTRFRTSSDGEGDEIDSVDVPRYKSSSGSAAAPPAVRSNLSRPVTPSRPFGDSTDDSRTTPTATRSHVRSFSRPMPFLRSSANRPSAPTAMGAPSIIRNGQPSTSTSQPISSSSEPISEAATFGRLGVIPPRFQPGRVIVKDSDLDTIAEADSVYTASIHNDSRRGSYASTIDADIPRRRRNIGRSGSQHQYDGVADDESEADDDDSSLRTSTYGFSDEEADSIDEAAPSVPRRFNGLSPTGTGFRSSYYANPSGPHEYDPSLSNSDIHSHDYTEDSATDSGDETERENDPHPNLDEDSISYHVHLSDLSSSSSHAHAVRWARERTQSYDPNQITAITGEAPDDRPGTPDTFDLSYGMPELPDHDLADACDGTADANPAPKSSTQTATHDFAFTTQPPLDGTPKLHALTPQASFTSQTSQTPSQRDTDTISLADSSYTLDSVNSATSNLTASWYKSPRERLGLGGFIRHSGAEVPWDDHPPSPRSPKSTGRGEGVKNVDRRETQVSVAEMSKDSHAMIRYMLQSHDGASDRPGGAASVEVKGGMKGGGGGGDGGLRKTVGRKSLLGILRRS